ncbi:MAG: STAS domain-containing protein [Bryobacteraceae bacterium]
MNLQTRQEGDIQIVEMEGSLDGKTAPEVREQLRPILAHAQKLILDLTKVDYLSSAGLRLLLLTYREVTAAHGKVVLLGVSREIQTVMSHTGFLSFFTLCDSFEKATQALA